MPITYAVAILGLLSTYSLQWIYFDVDACRNFTHALRRNVLTGFLFTAVHLPIQMAIVAAGAALGLIVEISVEYAQAMHDDPGNTEHLDEILTPSIRWVYCVSMACALWFMALLGTLHKSLDQVTVTPLDTLSKKMINFISGYGFVASRERSDGANTSGASDQQGASSSSPLSPDPTNVSNIADTLSEDSGSSSSHRRESFTSSRTGSTSSSLPPPKRRTAVSDFFNNVRSRHQQYKAARLSVTNVRKATRIMCRIVVGLIIALLPLAGTQLSPVGLVGTVAGLLTGLVIFELWGGLRRNSILNAQHHSPASGLAMMLVAAATMAPSLVLSAHGHDHDENPHVAHKHRHGQSHGSHGSRSSQSSSQTPRGSEARTRSTGSLGSLFSSLSFGSRLSMSSPAGSLPTQSPSPVGDATNAVPA